MLEFIKKLLGIKEAPKEIQDKTNDTVDIIPLDIENLHFIEETIAKLKLINLSHGQTEYLTKQILTYENKLSEIKENYEEENNASQDTLTLVLQDKRMEYLLSLSTLKDEVENFSKICFDLEGLDVLLHQEITEENINAKKEELKKLEQQIELHKNEYPKLGKQLQEKLIEVIWHVLEQEVKLNQERDLYMKLSRNSSLLIQKKYLEKLVELAERDSYIQEYLKQTNIQFIDFDYEMLSYMVSGKLPKKEIKEIEEVEQPCLDSRLEVSILRLNENTLKMFEIRGRRAAITDYAILLGGYVSDDYYVEDKPALENRTGWYWTKSVLRRDEAFAIESDGTYSKDSVNFRCNGVRPALPFSFISSICRNLGKAQDGILEVEYGEYPQQAVPENLQIILEKLYQKRKLKETGKIYTRDSTRYNQFKQKFQAEVQEEYEYNGKKYVRVRANSYFDGGYFVLSNGQPYKDEDYVWIEVEPIKWLVDLENDIAVAEKILFSGIQFKNTRDYKGDFENTDLKWYLDTYFSKEILPTKSYDLVGSDKETQPKVKQKKKDLLSDLNNYQ